MLPPEQRRRIQREAWQSSILTLVPLVLGVIGVRLASGAGAERVRDLGWGLALVAFIVLWWIERRFRPGR